MSSSGGAAGAGRGGPGRRATRGRVQRRRGRGRRARDAEGRVLEGVRLAGRAHARRRPGVAVGLLRGRHGDRRRREGPARLRVLRRASGCRCAHRRSRWRRTPGTRTTTSADRTCTPAAPTSPCSGRWRAGYLYKPPGKGRRVTGTGAPDPQNAAHVGYLTLNHLSGYAGSAGWPDWELPFIEWAEREGFEIGVCTNADLEEHPEVFDDAQPVPVGRSRRVLVAWECATRSKPSSRVAATPRSSRATRRCGRCASRATITT